VSRSVTSLRGVDQYQLTPSTWTVTEARSLAGEYRQVASTDDQYNGVELFGALCGYLDDLYGADGFDRLPTDDQRSILAAGIARIRTEAPTGSVLPDDSSEETEPDDQDVVVRLDQPVNSAVTLADGRVLAERLAAADGWQRELGRALIALYALLDDLYGGPGDFVELLDLTERAEVAERLAALAH
jgi:hypothetical protein